MGNKRSRKQMVFLAVGLCGFFSLTSCHEPVAQREVTPVPSAKSSIAPHATDPRALVPRLPDLGQCTRLEVRYYPSPMEFFFGNAQAPTYVSPEEVQYVRSLQVVEVTDPEFIKVLADRVRKTRFTGARGVSAADWFVHYTAYCGLKRVMAFTRLRNALMTEDEYWFDGDKGWEDTLYLPPRTKPLQVRGRCAGHLSYLHGYLQRRLRDDKALPSADKWCDVIREDLRAERQSEEFIMDLFRCPGAQGGPCHYAMNPNCTADSPKDMVFLFEAKPGWNQHGGPELFTFDHHDPRGGLVLLNDGWESMGSPTIRFIRTEEELKQLRWK